MKTVGSQCWRVRRLAGFRLAGFRLACFRLAVSRPAHCATCLFPTAYANTWLHHPGETIRLPAIHLFTLNPVYTEDWRISPPGYDPATGIYYAGSAIEARPMREARERERFGLCARCDHEREPDGQPA